MIICNTNAVKDFSVKVDNIDPLKIEIIPCAFNKDIYAKGIENITGLSREFYFVGRLVDQKMPLELIDVFAEVIKNVPGCKLTCVGDGPLLGDCRELVKYLGLTDCIFLAGYMPNPFKLARPDAVFVLNSSYEGQGIVLLEAMAQGLVCIAPDCGGVSDVITTDVNGFLFKANNKTALRNLIYRVLSMDVHDINIARHNAYNMVTEKYSPEVIAHRYSEVYLRLLKSKQATYKTEFPTIDDGGFQKTSFA